MRRALIPLFLLGSCLPANLAVTPPNKFGIYEPATILEPNEKQFSVGHAQPLLPSVAAPGETVTSFLELDAKLRKGFTQKLEGQISANSMLDFRLGAGRVGVKYALPGTESFHWALSGGAALGFNGRDPGSVSTTRAIYGGIDGALHLSGPRYWRFVPYGALGATANATALVFGLNESGVKDERSASLITPHATVGVDIGFDFARLLFETTSLMTVIPGQDAIPNALVAFSVAFTIGKVRYLTPREKALPKESTLCEVGTIEVDGVCYIPCQGKLAERCPSSQICVVYQNNPKCITGVAQMGTYRPSTEPTSNPETKPSSTPASIPDAVKEIVEPESQPTKEPEARDDLTICLAKGDGVAAKERISICKRYLAAHPNDPSTLLIQGRLLELQSE
jgi:hypothetical protein